MNALKALRRFYNDEKRQMIYPNQSVSIQSDHYAAELIRAGAAERIGKLIPTTLEINNKIKVSGYMQDPIIETKEIRPKRNAKRN